MHGDEMGQLGISKTEQEEPKTRPAFDFLIGNENGLITGAIHA